MSLNGLLATVSVLLILVSRAAGDVLFSDNFEYGDGPLVLVSEGKWKTHSGTAGQVEVTAGAIQLSQRQSEDVSAAFPGGAVGPLQALAIYAGFNVTFTDLPTGGGTYFAHFKDTTATAGFRCRIFASTNGAAAGHLRLGVAAGTNSATALLADDLKLDTPYRIVCRLLLGNNDSTLWLDPHAETDAYVTSTDDAAPKTAAAFAFRESLASSSGMGELLVDNLTVTTTFAETASILAPTILKQPHDVSVPAGGDATFSIQASGTGPLYYQWLFEGTDIPGATESVLVLRNVGFENAGIYEVAVGNQRGSRKSAPAHLTVQPPELAVHIEYSPSGIWLRWMAAPDQSYSVWTTDSVTGELRALATDLVFADGAGLFVEDWTFEVMRLYRISSP